MTCEKCREQILPYLYEILEPAEAQELAGHLLECAACQEALKTAQEQRELLAEAVKSPDENIIFRAPAQTIPASAPPASEFTYTPKRRPIFLNRWVMAAAVMFVIFTLGFGLGGASWREFRQSETDAKDQLAEARRSLAKSQTALNEHNEKTRKDIVAIQQEIDNLVAQWKKEEDVTRTKLEKDRVQLIVKGPKVAVAGANNNYDVTMSQQSITNFQQNPIFNNKQQQVPQQQQLNTLNTRVINNQTKEIVYQQRVQLNQDNKGNFKLPPDMPIKPTDDLALEFETLDPDGKSVFLRDNLKLVFPEYVTHLSTDRPMYRPGDTVRFRSLTLERFSLKPAQQDLHLSYRILNSRNEVVFKKEVAAQLVMNKNKAPIKGPDGQPLRGLGAGDFTLPADEPEGNYTLSVSEMNDRFNEERRTFQVRRWPTARYHKEITFDRSAYSAGDIVKFRVRVTPLSADPVLITNVNFSAMVHIDGQRANDVVQTQRSQFEKNEAIADFQFTLPPNIARGKGTVSITCNDSNGPPDQTVRSIPIAVRDMTLEFYPEGGELIAGVPNRVYFQARTPAGRPADFEGVVLDEKRQVVARIQTMTDDREPGINQGLGSFTFTPQPKRRYHVKVESPIGIDRVFNLPAAKASGVALHIPQGIVDKEINVVVHSARGQRELLIGAYCRGRMLDNKIVKVGPEQPVEVTLRPQAPAGGVYRITVFDKVHENGAVTFRPVAERLVYRKNQAHVEVDIAANRESYQPGQPVELQLRARNEKREFVPAVAMVAVFDNSVGRIANIKTDRSMPTHFLLTTEIRNPEDLENADVLLGDHPRAAEALDLLLGAQGWRRFAEQDPIVFTQKQQQSKAPVFLANSAAVPQFLESEQKQLDKLDQEYVVQAIDLNRRLAGKEKDEAGPIELLKDANDKVNMVQFSENEVENARQRVHETQALLTQFGLGGALLTLLFVGFFLISVGLQRLTEGGHARPWFFCGAALLTLLFLVSVIGTFTLMGERFLDDWRNGPRAVNVGVPPQNQNVAPPIPILPLPEDIELLDERELPRSAPGKGEVQQVDENNFLPGNLNNQDFRDLLNQAIQQVPQVAPPVDAELPALRQLGQYHSILERQLGRRVQLPPASTPSVARVYAHQHKPTPDAAGFDFAETVYWHPALVMEDGSAKIDFTLSDTVTRYDVIVLSHTLDGRVGASRMQIAANLPFRMSPSAPPEITENDQLTLPIRFSNETAKDVAGKFRLRSRGFKFEGPEERILSLKAKESANKSISLRPTIKDGNAALRLVGKTGSFVDAVERHVKVTPTGFLVRGSVSGFVENGGVENVIVLPNDWIPGSLEIKAHLYPSPAAEVRGALDALLREPAGTYEQKASLQFANVLLVQALNRDAPTANWIAGKNARDFVSKNASKLAAFETDRQVGFRRFLSDEAADPQASAFALLLLREQAKMGRADPELIERTQAALLDFRDKAAKTPDVLLRAYLLWALTEAGVKVDDAALAATYKEAKARKEPNLLGLAALSLLNRGKTEDALDLLRQLTDMQVEGEIVGAKSSITGSKDRELGVETTSLAILAWMKADRPDEFSAHVLNSVKWLAQQRQHEGSYGGGPVTILALKARLAYHQKNPRVINAGEAEISLRSANFAPGPGPGMAGDPNGPAPNRANLRRPAGDVVTLWLLETEATQPGKNAVHLSVGNGSAIPYSLTWSYRTQKIPADNKAAVKLNAKLGSEQAKLGDVVKLHATVENTSRNALGTTVAIFGLPAGTKLENTAQLDALTKDRLSAWELRGRELTLFWRELPAGAKVAFDVDLKCAFSGDFHGPASRVFAGDESRNAQWSEPLRIRIVENK